MGEVGCASLATSDISRLVPASIPLEQRMSGVPAGACATTARRCWAGLTISNRSRSAMAAMSPVASIEALSGMAGR